MLLGAFASFTFAQPVVTTLVNTAFLKGGRLAQLSTGVYLIILLAARSQMSVPPVLS